MSSKRYCREIILLYLLLLVPWPQNKNVVKVFCSKDNSRLVRKIIKAKWTPILEKYQVKFPLECPLHPLRDIFGPRQDAKKRHRPTQWTCKICGKSFYQEKFVDNHFDVRHKHLINKAEDSVCLSEFCDIMRCDVFQSEESKLSGSDSAISTDIEVWGSSAFGKLSSSSSALVKSNNKLSPTRDSTVLTGGSKKHQSRHVCPEQIASQTNSNSKNAKESPDQSKTDPSTQADDSKNDSNKEEQKVNVNSSTDDSPTADATIENYINMSKIKASCQSEELAKLKTKCEFLVRSCVGSLLLKMSDEKFKEMEAELNKAICWYLSCERYWEDGPLEPRAFPWGLMIVVIFVLSLGTCFCYYIIWILFEAEDPNNQLLYQQHQPQHHHHQKAYTDYHHQPMHHQGPASLAHHIDPLYDYRHSPRYIPQHHIQSSTMEMMETSSTNSMMGMQSPPPLPLMQESDKDSSILRSTDLNEISHNEHYIYVTYPPDLKNRLYDKYEG